MDVNEYIKQSVAASTLHVDPFCYAYIENMFPTSQYNLLKDLVPNPDDFVQSGPGNRTHRTKVTGRSLTPYFEENLIETTNDEKFIDYFMWVRDFLMPTIGEKLGIKYTVSNTRLHCAFTNDTAGYFKRPHTDHPNKIFTLLLYMSYSDIGTTIVRPKQQGFVDPEGDDWKFSEFNDVYTAPFKPNCGLVFQRTDYSFHCVRKVTSTIPRLAFHAHVWYK